MSSRARVFFCILIICAILFFANLGLRGLWEPDEGRYSEIPREMIESGDWVVPHLNHVLYFEKPPMGYWLNAISYELFGYGEWQGRFFPALLALGGVLFVCWAGMRFWNERSGLFSALILITSLEYFILARVITLDMILTFFITAQMLLFYFGYMEPESKRKRWFYLGSWAAMGLAVLTKGPMAIVVPGMVIFMFLVLRGELRRLREIQIPLGIAVFSAITVPWFLLVISREPSFFHFFFINEHWNRFFHSAHKRTGPVYYFIPVLLAGFYPWVFFLPSAIGKLLSLNEEQKSGKGLFARIRAYPPEALYLVLWCAVFFLLFSLSSSKLPTYILPIFPALALLVGRWWANAAEGGNDVSSRSGLLPFIFIGVFTILLGIAGWYVYNSRTDIDESVILAQYMLVIIAAGMGSAAVYWRRSQRGHSFFAIVIVFFIVLFIVPFAAKNIEEIKCTKALSTIINSEFKPGEKIIHFGLYEQSMPFYTGQRIVLIDFGGELEFGLERMGENEYYYKPVEGKPHPIGKLIRGDTKVYILTFDDDAHFGFLKSKYSGDLIKLGNVGEKILLSNEPYLEKRIIEKLWRNN